MKKATQKKETAPEEKRLYELCPCKTCGHNPPLLQSIVGDYYLAFCSDLNHRITISYTKKEDVILNWNTFNGQPDHKPTWLKKAEIKLREMKDASPTAEANGGDQSSPGLE